MHRSWFQCLFHRSKRSPLFRQLSPSTSCLTNWKTSSRPNYIRLSESTNLSQITLTTMLGQKIANSYSFSISVLVKGSSSPPRNLPFSTLQKLYDHCIKATIPLFFCFHTNTLYCLWFLQLGNKKFHESSNFFSLIYCFPSVLLSL